MFAEGGDAVDDPEPGAAPARAVPAPDPGHQRRLDHRDQPGRTRGDHGRHPGLHPAGRGDLRRPGTDEAGITYSNDGGHPGRPDHLLQAVRLLRPACSRARRTRTYDKTVKPKETLITVPGRAWTRSPRLKIAQGQYQRFAEPGITGNITLTTDLALRRRRAVPTDADQGRGDASGSTGCSGCGRECWPTSPRYRWTSTR